MVTTLVVVGGLIAGTGVAAGALLVTEAALYDDCSSIVAGVLDPDRRSTVLTEVDQ